MSVQRSKRGEVGMSRAGRTAGCTHVFLELLCPLVVLLAGNLINQIQQRALNRQGVSRSIPVSLLVVWSC